MFKHSFALAGKLQRDYRLQLRWEVCCCVTDDGRPISGEAMAAGVPIAVCSTSNERAVSTIVKKMLGPEVAAKMRVFAGDVVPKKKPDPAIYLLAAKELGLDPSK